MGGSIDPFEGPMLQRQMCSCREKEIKEKRLMIVILYVKCKFFLIHVCILCFYRGGDDGGVA